MSDIDLIKLRQHIDGPGKVYALLEAAACVANAIHIGAGAMIVGSLMEADLRKALGLKRGQLVKVTPNGSGERNV